MYTVLASHPDSASTRQRPVPARSAIILSESSRDEQQSLGIFSPSSS